MLNSRSSSQAPPLNQCLWSWLAEAEISHLGRLSNHSFLFSLLVPSSWSHVSFLSSSSIFFLLSSPCHFSLWPHQPVCLCVFYSLTSLSSGSHHNLWFVEDVPITYPTPTSPSSLPNRRQFFSGSNIPHPRGFNWSKPITTISFPFSHFIQGSSCDSILANKK